MKSALQWAIQSTPLVINSINITAMRTCGVGRALGPRDILYGDMFKTLPIPTIIKSVMLEKITAWQPLETF
jgi:hypothetical protein